MVARLGFVAVLTFYAVLGPLELDCSATDVCFNYSAVERHLLGKAGLK